VNLWAQKQRKNCFGRRKIDEKADEEKEKRFDWKRKIKNKTKGFNKITKEAQITHNSKELYCRPCNQNKYFVLYLGVATCTQHYCWGTQQTVKW